MDRTEKSPGEFHRSRQITTKNAFDRSPGRSRGYLENYNANI